MSKLKCFILLLTFLFAGNLYADCTFAGKQYSEGETIPGYICKENRWVKK